MSPTPWIGCCIHLSDLPDQVEVISSDDATILKSTSSFVFWSHRYRDAHLAAITAPLRSGVEQVNSGHFFLQVRGPARRASIRGGRSTLAWSRNGEQQRPLHPLNASDLQSMRLENSNDVLLGMSDDDRVGTVSLLADKIYKLSVVFLAAVSAE
jgi:hypothetical protein